MTFQASATESKSIQYWLEQSLMSEGNVIYPFLWPLGIWTLFLQDVQRFSITKKGWTENRNGLCRTARPFSPQLRQQQALEWIIFLDPSFLISVRPAFGSSIVAIILPAQLFGPALTTNNPPKTEFLLCVVLHLHWVVACCCLYGGFPTGQGLQRVGSVDCSPVCVCVAVWL